MSLGRSADDTNFVQAIHLEAQDWQGFEAEQFLRRVFFILIRNSDLQKSVFCIKQKEIRLC